MTITPIKNATPFVRKSRYEIETGETFQQTLKRIDARISKMQFVASRYMAKPVTQDGLSYPSKRAAKKARAAK